jgi:hypothetical protein
VIKIEAQRGVNNLLLRRTVDAPENKSHLTALYTSSPRHDGPRGHHHGNLREVEIVLARIPPSPPAKSIEVFSTIRIISGAIVP